MCLAQGHNAVTLVRLKPAAPRSRVKLSTTESWSSLRYCIVNHMKNEVVRMMIGTIYRWPLKYSVYKLYKDMQATKPLMQSCAYHNACTRTIRRRLAHWPKFKVSYLAYRQALYFLWVVYANKCIMLCHNARKYVTRPSFKEQVKYGTFACGKLIQNEHQRH